MSDLIRRQSAQNTPIAYTGSAAYTGPAIMGTAWPVGDTLVRDLVLRWSGTVTVTLGGGALSVVKQQVARLLAGITFGTDKHKAIVDQGMDGLSLLRMLAIAAKKDPYYVDIPSTASGPTPFECTFRIPFLDAQGARGWDSVIDLLISQPYLRHNYNAVGPNTIGTITGGTGSSIVLSNLTMEASLQKYDGPFVDSNGAPAFPSVAPSLMPYWGLVPNAITATQSQAQFDVLYGDRIIKRLFIFSRDSVTNAERSDIIGQSDNDRVSLTLNGVPILDNVQVRQLMAENVQDYAPATVPAGTLVLDWHKLFGDGVLRGARVSNDLMLLTPAQQTVKLKIDVTSQNGGSPSLYFGYDCYMALPDAAKRPEQLAPKVAAAQNASKTGK